MFAQIQGTGLEAGGNYTQRHDLNREADGASVALEVCPMSIAVSPLNVRRPVAMFCVALLLAIAGTFLDGNVLPAKAVGCNGNSCEGQWAGQMGCKADEYPERYIVVPQNGAMPSFTLWHYYSPRCNASWGETYSANPGLTGAFGIYEFSDYRCTNLVAYRGHVAPVGDPPAIYIETPMASESTNWVYVADNPDWSIIGNYTHYIRTPDCI